MAVHLDQQTCQDTNERDIQEKISPHRHHHEPGLDTSTSPSTMRCCWQSPELDLLGPGGKVLRQHIIQGLLAEHIEASSNNQTTQMPSEESLSVRGQQKALNRAPFNITIMKQRYRLPYIFCHDGCSDDSTADWNNTVDKAQTLPATSNG
eukprot:4101259-Amphidinium_carterae.2